MAEHDMYKMLAKGKKRGQNMGEHEKGAMMGVLKDIHKMASDDMGHDIHGLKKVSVASDTTNGLKAGLDQAKGMVQNHSKGTFDNKDANKVSDDMHADSHRHPMDKESETWDQEPEEDDTHDGMPKKGDEADSEDYGKGGANGTKLGRYAKGGMVNGAEHQHQSGHDVIDDPEATIMRERNYAEGGMIDTVDEDEEEANAHGAEHQSNQSRGVDSRAAQPTINKERDTRVDPSGRDKAEYHSGGMIDGTMGQGTHGTHASADVSDEYSDLEPEDLEAFIAHLQRYRKTNSSF
jgi:hypothetical protein